MNEGEETGSEGREEEGNNRRKKRIDVDADGLEVGRHRRSRWERGDDDDDGREGDPASRQGKERDLFRSFWLLTPIISILRSSFYTFPLLPPLLSPARSMLSVLQ